MLIKFSISRKLPTVTFRLFAFSHSEPTERAFTARCNKLKTPSEIGNIAVNFSQFTRGAILFRFKNFPHFYFVSEIPLTDKTPNARPCNFLKYPPNFVNATAFGTKGNARRFSTINAIAHHSLWPIWNWPILQSAVKPSLLIIHIRKVIRFYI